MFSPDGRRQIGIMRNYEEAPELVGETQGGVWDQMILTAFAGDCG